ncbi:TIGR02569 family protein [Rhodococcus aerolatus]
MTPPVPPEHVLATFGLRESDPEEVGPGWDRGWRYGDVVLSPVVDHARAAWSAGVRETLQVEGVRMARPVRSTDGRWVVSGWSADTFLAGEPEPRHDEVVAVAGRLHAATAAVARPRFLAPGPGAPLDVFTAADRASWGEDLTRLGATLRAARGGPSGPGPDAGSTLDAGLPDDPDDETPDPAEAEAARASSAELYAALEGLREPVTSPAQLVHGDLFGTVLFAGAAPPGITDLTPYWRPAAWAAGVAVVDAVAWGGADTGLIDRWEHLPEWSQQLLRALLFRLAVHALHPRSTLDAFPGLEHVAALVRPRVAAR